MVSVGTEQNVLIAAAPEVEGRPTPQTPCSLLWGLNSHVHEHNHMHTTTYTESLHSLKPQKR